MSSIIKLDSIAKKLYLDLKPFFLNNKRRIAVLNVGDNPSSIRYLQIKKKIAEELNIELVVIQIQKNCTKKELISKILELNDNVEYHGIILQLPLPNRSFTNDVVKIIDTNKDIDCLNPSTHLSNKIIPCTANSIKIIDEKKIIDFENKKVLIIGKSMIAGEPIYQYLTTKYNDVKIVDKENSFKEISQHLLESDIVISCTGKRHYINDKSQIKQNSYLIDVGFEIFENKIYGDINAEALKDYAKKIIPTPNGIGKLTTFSLFYNLYKLSEKC